MIISFTNFYVYGSEEFPGGDTFRTYASCSCHQASPDKMWTSREFPVMLVLCFCKIFAKNQDRQDISEFVCEAQDKRGIPWESEGGGLKWHSCDEIDNGNHDISIATI